MVNSAGILCRESFFNTTKQNIADCLNINTIGAFDLCQQAAWLIYAAKNQAP
jgi:NAD(P)-dependent dehydrogenase (short-subunit alcohol dehydrogenase family)